VEACTTREPAGNPAPSRCAEGRRWGSTPRHTSHAQHGAQVMAHAARHTTKCRSTPARAGEGHSVLNAPDMPRCPSWQVGFWRGLRHGSRCLECLVRRFRTGAYARTGSDCFRGLAKDQECVAGPDDDGI
jgi:hypothetical protein